MESVPHCSRLHGILFGTFVVAPAVVAWWRTVWYAMDGIGCDDYGVQPAPGAFCLSDVEHHEANGWWSAGAAFIVFLVITAGKQWPGPRYNPLLRLAWGFALSYLSGVAVVASWRGIWYILDARLYSDSNLTTAAWASTVLGLVIGLVTGGLRSTLVPPVLYLADIPMRPQTAPGFYRLWRGSRQFWRTRVGIVVDTVALIAVTVATVATFRGVWLLLDWYTWLRPPGHSLLFSGWTSLMGGALVTVLAAVVQPVVQRPAHAVALAVLDRAVTLVLVGAGIAFWRGAWALVDVYSFPSAFWTSNAITHAVTTAVLVVYRGFNSVQAPPAVTAYDDGGFDAYPTLFQEVLAAATTKAPRPHVGPQGPPHTQLPVHAGLDSPSPSTLQTSHPVAPTLQVI